MSPSRGFVVVPDGFLNEGVDVKPQPPSLEKS